MKGDIVYRRVNGTELSLDAYVQKRGHRRPAVMVIHGGGWNAGSRIAYVGQFLEMLTRAGYNWFSVDYRLGPLERYSDAVDDLRAALAFIRCHADTFRIDPNRIALLGEDAGANLAALLAAEKPVGVKASVLIGGFYDLRSIEPLKAATPAEILAQASPFTRAVSDLPDALVVHGTADREVPEQQARRFCETLRGVGGNCEYLAIDGAIHRAENWRPEQWSYKDFVAQWLAKKLELATPDHEPYGSRLKKEIVYRPQHGLKLDAYVPPGRGPFPAVIIAHGGGWESGDKATYVTPLFDLLARAGFAWFSIDYRLTPQFRHWDQLDDLRAAIRFVRDGARKFNLDPQRIAILGESASGQMVAQVAAEAPEGIAAVVSFYGVYDFEAIAKEITPRSIPTRLFGITKLDDEARATLRRYSPLHRARKEMPPMLLICGTKDSLFAQHTAFAQRLDQAGARYNTFPLVGAPHGLENWEGNPAWMSYKQKLVDWLHAQMRRSKG